MPLILEPRKVMEALTAAGVPAGVVQRSSDLLVDPQYRHRGFWREYEHPEIGLAPYPGPPNRIHGYDAGARGRDPLDELASLETIQIGDHPVVVEYLHLIGRELHGEEVIRRLVPGGCRIRRQPLCAHFCGDRRTMVAVCDIGAIDAGEQLLDRVHALLVGHDPKRMPHTIRGGKVNGRLTDGDTSKLSPFAGVPSKRMLAPAKAMLSPLV